METLVQLSFYSFTAASIALALATISYGLMAVGRVRLRHNQLATPGGATFSATTAEHVTEPSGFARYATMLAWFAVVFQGLAVLFRAIAAGRGPYSNMYEFSMGFTFALVLIYLLFERFYGIKQLGAVAIPVALAMSIYVWLLPTHMREVDALNPALQNRPLMTAHVSTAIISYAAFAVAFAAAVLYLISNWKKVSWLPGPEVFDDIGFRAVTIGFPMLGLVLILGSIWAHQAWGVWWSWDPKETASLFTFLVYSVYLHTRTLRDWRGKRSAIVLIIGFGAVLFTYYGNYVFGGLHAYGGVD